MSFKTITIARIYTIEGHDHADQVLKILHDEIKVSGVSLIRGIAGYGEDGEIHTSSLISLSMELPIIIEFFDQPEKVEKALQVLKSRLELKHVISWPATAYFEIAED